jgi:hypothetical protein
MRFALLLALAGCYHPTISEGTIYCSEDTPPKCPSGFSCGFDGLCYKTPPVKSPYGDGSIPEMDLTGMNGVMVLHTDNGAITLKSVGMDEIILVPSPSPEKLGLYKQPLGGPPVTIWSFKRLIVPLEVTIQVSSDSRAIPVLAGTGDITQTPGPTLKILGPIELSGSGGSNGGPNAPGLTAPDSTEPSGQGAAMASIGGGGGGGHLSKGEDGTGTGAGKGGGASSALDDVLVFGGGGGGGGGVTMDAFPGFGGPGGGAIGLIGFWVQLNGLIDLTGQPGQPAMGGMAGGGGGAGGTLFVSAKTLTYGPNLKVDVSGGAGGPGGDGGGNGGQGAAGRIRFFQDTLQKNDTAQFQPMTSFGGIDKALLEFPPNQ